MSEILVQIGPYLLGGAVVGGLAVWLLRGGQVRRALESADEEWQNRLEVLEGRNEQLAAQNASLNTALDASRKAAEQHKHAAISTRTEIESLREKLNSLSKDMFELGTERDDLGGKLILHQKTLVAARQRIAELQTEFAKSRDFYKGQLGSAFEQRRVLERKIGDSRLERESLTNLLASAKAEHDSVSNLLAAARSRLQNMDGMEQKVVALEADNAELRHEIATVTRQADSLHRDAAEVEALKVQNRELAHCLESMENSRKQYEIDAHRYRTQYDQSEQESETLRIKLGDIEKSLAEMQEQQVLARKAVAEQRTTTRTIGIERPDGEIDNLTEIVGIGKVFEAMLHRLGIYYFRQIASFGPSELARVNAELKEFKGRIEHDDWIGQARELHFRKYGVNGKVADAG